MIKEIFLFFKAFCTMFAFMFYGTKNMDISSNASHLEYLKDIFTTREGFSITLILFLFYFLYKTYEQKNLLCVPSHCGFLAGGGG